MTHQTVAQCKATKKCENSTKKKFPRSNKAITYRFTDVHVAAVFDVDDTLGWAIMFVLSDYSSLESWFGRAQSPNPETQIGYDVYQHNAQR